MRNIFTLAFAASLVTITSIASADPVGIYIEIDCPVAQIQSNNLTNHGNYISGYGLEKIQGYTDTSLLFKSTTSVKGVPANLQNYNNSGVKYSSATGEVSCEFASKSGDPAFKVVYTLKNGKGGKASPLTNDKMFVLIPFGK